MSRRQKDSLRPLTEEERRALEQLSRATSEPASHVARAQLVLAVAAGHSYTAAARSAGRRSGDAVAPLIARFNREGLAAVAPRHGGGAAVVYGEAERARILAEARRTPEREADGTATWSLSTLRRALRRAPDGLPGWGNWWALFILIPAAGAASTAWTLYRRAGDRLTPAARRSAISAATFTFVAAMFLFGLSWGLLWPVFLIFFGLEALASRAA